MYSGRPAAGQHGVRGFPTIKFMYHDGKAIKAVDYKGGRTAKEIITFGMDKAKALALKRIGEKASKSSGTSSGTGSSGALPLRWYSAGRRCHMRPTCPRVCVPARLAARVMLLSQEAVAGSILARARW